jgi:hypothetical protein
MELDPEQQQIFDSVPEDGPRSRLEPHRELILRWRRQGRSYRRIRELLAEKYSVTISRQVLTRFIERRSRPRKVEPESEQRIVQPAESSLETAPPVTPKPRMTLEERIAQRDAIRAQFAKSALPAKLPDTRPRFEYDPDKPLTIDRTIKD